MNSLRLSFFLLVSLAGHAAVLIPVSNALVALFDGEPLDANDEDLFDEPERNEHTHRDAERKRPGLEVVSEEDGREFRHGAFVRCDRGRSNPPGGRSPAPSPA